MGDSGVYMIVYGAGFVPHGAYVVRTVSYFPATVPLLDLRLLTDKE